MPTGLVPPPPPDMTAVSPGTPAGGNIFDAYDPPASSNQAQGGNIFDAYDPPQSSSSGASNIGNAYSQANKSPLADKMAAGHQPNAAPSVPNTEPYGPPAPDGPPAPAPQYGAHIASQGPAPQTANDSQETMEAVRHAPLVGHIIQGVEQGINELSQVPRQLGRNPLGATLALPGNLLAGATGGVEALTAPVVQAVGNAARGIAGKPPVSYPQAMQQMTGQPSVAANIANFYRVPGTQHQKAVMDTQQAIGNILSSVVPFAGAERLAAPIFKAFIKSPIVAKMLTDAATGGTLGAAYGQGGRTIAGQPTTAGNVAEDAATGAGLGLMAAPAGRVLSKLKKEKPSAPSTASTPQIGMNAQEPIPVEAEVMPPEQPQTQEQSPKQIGMKPSPRQIGMIHKNAPPLIETTKPSNFQAYPWDSGSPIAMGGRPHQVTEPTLDQIRRAQQIREAQTPDYGGQRAQPPLQAETPKIAPEQPKQKLQGHVEKQVKVPKQYTFSSVEEAADAIYGKNPDKADAAAQYLKESLEKKKPQGSTTPSTKQGQQPSIEEEIAKKYGRPVPKVSPKNEAGEDPSTFHARKQVPVEEVTEKDGSPFDLSNKTPREAFWSQTGRTYAAEPHPRVDGKVRLGAQISDAQGKSKGAYKRAEALEPMNKGTSVSQVLDDKDIGHTEAQRESLKGALKHVFEGETKEVQARAVAEAGGLTGEDERLPWNRGVLHANPIKAVVDQAAWAAKQTVKDIKSGDYSAPLKRAFGKENVDAFVDAAFWHRDTHDVIAQYAPKLDRYLRMNEANEAAARMQGGLEGHLTEEAKDALGKMSPLEIMNSPKLNALSTTQRQGLAEAKFLRMDSKQVIKNFRDRLEDRINPQLEEHLDDYSKQLYGGRALLPHTTMDPYGDIIQTFTNQMAAAWFDKNPKFTGLVLTHPLSMVPGTSGFRALGEAYKLNAFDKEVHQMISRHPLTKDYRAEFRGKGGFPISEGANKLLEGVITKATSKLPEGVRNFSAAKYNNEIFALSKAIDDHGVETVRKYAQDINHGTNNLSQAKRTEIALSMWEGLEDATGGTASEFGRSAIEKSRLLRWLKPLSGYTSGVQKLYTKNTVDLVKGVATRDWRRAGNAFYKLAALQTARAVLGGSPLPPEIQEPMEKAMCQWDADAYLQYKFSMHHINVPRMLNMDISQHTSMGFKVGGNLVEPQVQSALSAARHGDAIKSASKIGQLVGGPVGGLLGRGAESVEKVAKGKEDIYVYMRSAVDSAHPIAHLERDYGAADALRDNTMMGESQDRANGEEKARVIHTLKETGKLTPVRLQAVTDEYPTSFRPAAKKPTAKLPSGVTES
jgi:hypothetical protein